MKPQKKSRTRNVVTVAILLVALLAVYQFIAVSRQPTFISSSTSLTKALYVSLQGTDFRMTNSSGCLIQETTGPYKGLTFEHFIVTVRNRFNETVQFVNATIFVGTIEFADGSTMDIFKSMLVAGPNDTAVFTFPVNFPISGAYFGRPYTNVDWASFNVVIYIEQYGRVQLFWLFPEVTVFLLREPPKC